MLARHIAIAIALASTTAAAAPYARVALDPEVGARRTGSVCNGVVRCLAHALVDPDGQLHADAAPSGLVPSDLWSAYQIDPNHQNAATVAIVDAFGYPALESDLAAYRSAFELGACTTANGCLTIVNEQGQTSPLPAPPPANDDWTLETALDVDMISAACPTCKIIVVQAAVDAPQDMLTAQNAAAALHPTVISDSFGAAESGDVTPYETYFDHPGIAQFAAGGDHGYGDSGLGPMYPSTSAHVIAVGGTSLSPAANARGWAESAWSSGGSSCSLSIAKPAYQTTTACNYRAANDISAVGDPQTGLSIYNAANGGWLVFGGTSAASPLTAAMFAATGNGQATAAEIAQSASVFNDVTSGSNGTCGSILCNAGSGWDGPTGYGTPNAAALAGGMQPPGGPLSIAITSPANGATVAEGFSIELTASGETEVGAYLDGVLFATATKPPYMFTAPRTATGPTTIQVAAIDASSHQVQAMVQVVVSDAPSDTEMPGCSAGGGGNGLALVFAIGLIAARRRRASTSSIGC